MTVPVVLGKKAALAWAILVLSLGITTSTLYLYRSHHATLSAIVTALVGVRVVGKDIEVVREGLRDEEVQKAIDNIIVPVVMVVVLMGLTGGT